MISNPFGTIPVHELVRRFGGVPTVVSGGAVPSRTAVHSKKWEFVACVAYLRLLLISLVDL